MQWCSDPAPWLLDQALRLRLGEATGFWLLASAGFRLPAFGLDLAGFRVDLAWIWLDSGLDFGWLSFTRILVGVDLIWLDFEWI